MRVLLSLDESNTAERVRAALRSRGLTVDVVDKAGDAVDATCGTTYEALILDATSANRDAYSALRRLRERKVSPPTLLITRTNVTERVEGLMQGADDCLSKPYAVEELFARVIALSRRSFGQAHPCLRIADLVLNLVTREVIRAGKRIDLSVREFALLEFLMQAPGRAFSKPQLIEEVWGWQSGTRTNIVEITISRLRKKIDEEHLAKLIRTSRSIGYMVSE